MVLNFDGLPPYYFLAASIPGFHATQNNHWLLKIVCVYFHETAAAVSTSQIDYIHSGDVIIGIKISTQSQHTINQLYYSIIVLNLIKTYVCRLS